jgi:hypothetical protein
MAVKRWNGTAWEVYAGADLAPVKVTDGRPGKTTFIGATSPTGQVDGDIWIDQDTTTNAVVPTALTTKGDTFVATGNAAYTRLAAGNNGESLFADSSTSTGLRWQGDYNTGKNKILNGDFSIWQRGTSFTSPADNAFVADRWRQNGDGTKGTRIWSRQSFTPGEISGYESQYYMRFQQSVAGSGASYQNMLIQPIEDVRTLAGKTVTLSYWAKADTAGRTIAPIFFRFYGTGSPTATDAVYGSISTLSTSWQRYTTTVNIPSISGKTISSADHVFQLIFTPTFNIAQTIDIWGIQLEEGSVATAFTTNTANPQAELAACQRYYEQSEIYGLIGHAYSSTQFAFNYKFNVPKRAVPSVSMLSAGSYNLYSGNSTPRTMSSVGSNLVGLNQVQFLATVSNATTAGYSCHIDGGVSNAIVISAEL